jgi:hypothetical protein
VGDDRLTGTAFDTWVLGAKATLRYAGAALILALSTTSSGADIRSPFGTYPGYVSLMERDFNRAGEDAWLVGLAYDFGRLGVPGLSAFFNVAQSTGARDPTTGEPLSNEREFDLPVDYRVTKKGWLEGLWFRFRGALARDGGLTTEKEIRLILNYEFRSCDLTAAHGREPATPIGGLRESSLGARTERPPLRRRRPTMTTNRPAA